MTAASLPSPDARRRMAWVAIGLGAVLAVAGALPWIGGAELSLRLLATLLILAGGFSVSIGMGLLRTIGIERARTAELAVDRAAADICAAHDGDTSACGTGECAGGCALSQLR